MKEEVLLAAIQRRKVRDRWFTGFLMGTGFFTLLPLFMIMIAVLWNGWRQLFTPSVALAAAGTAEVTALSLVVSVPFGVGLGLYLCDDRGTATANVIRHVANFLSGLPSLLIGMAVYEWLVAPMGSRSLVAGSVALAVMAVPYIARETENKLCSRAAWFHDGALAIGASRYQAWTRIALPLLARPLVAAILFSSAHMFGETAPLLFTAGGGRSALRGVFAPVPTLQLRVYGDALTARPSLAGQVYAGALGLTIFTLVIFMLAKWIEYSDTR